MCDKENDNHCKSTLPANDKVRNPFDKGLIERLHKPICSPGMCKVYKEKSSESFGWEITQACTLVPADIVACNSQFEPSPDPILEKIAEEATEQFFSQEMVMPSPLESSKKVKLLQSSPDSLPVTSFKESVVMKDVSAQTVLTLPPELPPALEEILQEFCTFTQEQNTSGEYEISANGSLLMKLFFEEHSEAEATDDSEQADERDPDRPPSIYDPHEQLGFSPHLTRKAIKKGMDRTFRTPINKGSLKTYHNKILDVVDFAEPGFSPIDFQTPKREVASTASLSSLQSASISPVTKITSSDEEKNNFTSPESEAMAKCLDCIASEPDNEIKGSCFCKRTPNKLILKRSASLKETPPRSRKTSLSFSEKRSLSMSSLHRSRSVLKLDFSNDMSIDASFHDQSHADSESSPPQGRHRKALSRWSNVGETSIHQLVRKETLKHQAQETRVTRYDNHILDETPIKGKCKSVVLSHEISKIRDSRAMSPLNMSLDNSIDSSENPLSLEDKKIDLNDVEFKFYTQNTPRDNFTANATKLAGDNSTSFKRVDSGFNENTFYANASSYYESAIKPSELTVTNISKLNASGNALKEISNVRKNESNWMRVDSGFKDENSVDSVQFYNESCVKNYRFSEARIEDKENVEDFDRFLLQSNNNATMSVSDVFTGDITFNCNYSSTPSKNKTRKANL